MIESAHNVRMQQAFDCAHQQRGQALVSLLKWLFGSKHVPLSQLALTEPSRCV